MADRPIECRSIPCDLVMRFPANWTGILFCGTLAVLHLCNAAGAFIKGRVEGELSLILGAIFICAACVLRLLRIELAVRPSSGCLRLSTSLGRVWWERFIPFADVQSVRLFFRGETGSDESRIEIICDGEALECPPTPVPRQQALCLAIAIGVPLIKVCGEGVGEVPPQAERVAESEHPIVPED